ncbi:hypothetical protein BU16DRAFT_557805 [Lophium mytilinum]|uniref:Uncharacterized protein n=1 Tax=Lophium mytilinum TaxID=390894 RepID=A0A6A6R564_9PEZI|nr:hypothetical protein BU16DRAFT_557805 [Lophium mytilinum]
MVDEFVELSVSEAELDVIAELNVVVELDVFEELDVEELDVEELDTVVGRSEIEELDALDDSDGLEEPDDAVELERPDEPVERDTLDSNRLAVEADDIEVELKVDDSEVYEDVESIEIALLVELDIEAIKTRQLSKNLWFSSGKNDPLYHKGTENEGCEHPAGVSTGYQYTLPAERAQGLKDVCTAKYARNIDMYRQIGKEDMGGAHI